MSDTPADVLSMIAEVRTILDAIAAGDMLAALPPAEVDRQRHASAVALIELARARLASIGA